MSLSSAYDDRSRGDARNAFGVAAERAAALRQIAANVELDRRRLASGQSGGAALSLTAGSGMEFRDLRLYRPGDDVRAIDWRVTARTMRPHVRLFHEDRDRFVRIIIDDSGSMAFPTSGSKFDLACRVAWILAAIAIDRRHRVTLHTASQSGRPVVSRSLPPLIRSTASAVPSGNDQWPEVLPRLARQREEAATMVLVLDCFASLPPQPLSVLGRRHELIAFVLEDALERRLPAAGMVTFRDAESGCTVTVDSSSATVRDAYRDRAKNRRRELARLLRRSGSRVGWLRTDRDLVDELRSAMSRHADGTERPATGIAELRGGIAS